MTEPAYDYHLILPPEAVRLLCQTIECEILGPFLWERTANGPPDGFTPRRFLNWTLIMATGRVERGYRN
jgi:hypothetical protein